MRCVLELRAALLTCVLFGVAAFPMPARAATVWAIDDGEKIGRDATSLPFKSGIDNPVWAPGQPIRLIGLRDEVVAFQVVVEAGGAALEGVSVDVAFAKPGDAIKVERFIEHFLEIKRPSSTGGGRGSLDWPAGSGPPPDRFKGWIPDALIPVEVAPAWSPWPMRVSVGQNAVVWIDVTVPPDQAPGTYRGEVVVRAAGDVRLAGLPIEIEVMPATMPGRPVATMLYYARDELARRVGDGERAERQLWELFHRHRVVPVHAVSSAEDVRAHLPALDGSAYTPDHGYDGPAAGVGDDVVVIGMYGSFGDADAAKLAAVDRIADELDAHGLFDSTDVVFYAEDEDCASPRGTAWSDRIKNSENLNAHRVRVAWTCSEDPARQPVDVPIVLAGEYDAAAAAAARAAGKVVWIYNGQRPATGSTLTDTEAISMRTMGWIAAMSGIPRWFLWETTFWYDGNPGGHGPYDPFVTAETFHNRYGEASMGGGVLVYPGRQIDGFAEHSLGFPGVIPSIRLKNLRRGIEDAGYLQLARAAAPAEAERIARALMPAVLGEAQPGKQPAWGERGKPFFEARRALAALIAPGVDRGPDPRVGTRARKPHFHIRWRWRVLAVAGVIGSGVLVYALRRARVGTPSGTAGATTGLGRYHALMRRLRSPFVVAFVFVFPVVLALGVISFRAVAKRAASAGGPAPGGAAVTPVKWDKPGLCTALVHDKLPHPMTPLAKPALGQVVVEPQFGTKIRRITAVPPGEKGGTPALRPMYSTMSAWNADESRLLLFDVNNGHQLYDGTTYKPIRKLDISPADIEQVYWHTSDPNVFFYVEDRTFIQYQVESGTKKRLTTFSFCTDRASAGSDPMFTSFDSRRIGLRCGDQVFIYDIPSTSVIVRKTLKENPPQVAPSGKLAYLSDTGFVTDEKLNPLRKLDLKEPFGHASMGRLPTGEDTWNGQVFDDGPRGNSDIGSLVTFDLTRGTSRVIIGPKTGYPYPTDGHFSAMAYRQPGWIFMSTFGDTSGKGLLDLEMVIADTATGMVCRAGRHRSWGKLNKVLGESYWAEAHMVPSPSGTRAAFASDWGNGATVDTFVLELPGYQP